MGILIEILKSWWKEFGWVLAIITDDPEIVNHEWKIFSEAKEKMEDFVAQWQQRSSPYRRKKKQPWNRRMRRVRWRRFLCTPRNPRGSLRQKRPKVKLKYVYVEYYRKAQLQIVEKDTFYESSYQKWLGQENKGQNELWWWAGTRWALGHASSLNYYIRIRTHSNMREWIKKYKDEHFWRIFCKMME